MQQLGLKQDCELFEIGSTYEERSVTVFSTFLTRTFWQTCSFFTAKDVLRGEVKVVNLVCVAGGFQRGARPWTSGAAARGMGKKCSLCNYPFPGIQLSRGRSEEMRVEKTARGWGRGWEVPSSLPFPHLLIFSPALLLRAALHYLNAGNRLYTLQPNC